MLKYKILITSGLTDNSILIPIGNVITPKLDTTLDDYINDTVQTLINPIVNVEKEAYAPISNYQVAFKFYNGSSFSADWGSAGFVDTDYSKNVFKKSQFLIEYYDTDEGSSNNLQFSTTLTVVSNVLTGKGPDGVFSSTYTVTNSKNELYYIYYNRDISQLPNLKTDSSNLKYISLYMKSMFLNAKTGNVQYFINDSSGILNFNQFNDTLYFYEIRLYENYTYGFYSNNVLQTTITLDELIIQ